MLENLQTMLMQQQHTLEQLDQALCEQQQQLQQFDRRLVELAAGLSALQHHLAAHTPTRVSQQAERPPHY